MKIMVYFLLALFIIGLVPFNNIIANSEVEILLQAADANASQSELNESARIMSERLNDYNMKPIDIKLIPEKKQIIITISKPADLKQIENLLIQKGNFGFTASGHSVMKSTDIGKMTIFQKDAETGLSIKFKPEAVELWAAATRENLNKTIAVMLDDRLIMDPLVREPILTGECVITGNFSPEELLFIAAIGNHGPLPLEFSVVK